MNSTQPTIIIFDFMRTLYDPESDSLIRGAIELLDACKKNHHEIYLLSRKEGQRRTRIDELDIAHYFKEIRLVEDKKIEMQLIRKLHPEKTIWVIGDRVRGEIRHGNEIGAVTVWFKNGLFQNEVPQTSEEKPDFTISKLSEFITILAQ